MRVAGFTAFFMLLLLPGPEVFPQEQGTPSIRWIRQYPPAATSTETHKKKGRFADFLFGKKDTPQLTRPVNPATDSKNGIWALDQGVGSIWGVHENVGDFTQVRKKPQERFPSLVGICRFTGNRLLFTDSYLNRVYVFDPDRKEITVLNDSLVLVQPTGIAFCETIGEIFVAETGLHSIIVLDLKGNRIRSMGRRGTGNGEYNFPTSLWCDKSCNLYVVDALNFRIQVFGKDGNQLSVFGRNGDGGGNLARPKGIATDSEGHIYVVDALFNAVQVFDLSGRFLYRFGMQGQGQGEFWMPSGICIDEQDNIYVADSYNSRIQVFQLTH